MILNHFKSICNQISEDKSDPFADRPISTIPGTKHKTHSKMSVQIYFHLKLVCKLLNNLSLMWLDSKYEFAPVAQPGFLHVGKAKIF